MSSQNKLVPGRLYGIPIECIKMTSDPGNRYDSVELERVADDPELREWLWKQVEDGNVVEIHPDQGPSVTFERLNRFKYRRTNLESDDVDVVDHTILLSHFRYGTGVVSFQNISE